MMASDGFTNAEIERIMADLGKKIDDLKTDLRAEIHTVNAAVAKLSDRVVYTDVHEVVTQSLRAEYTASIEGVRAQMERANEKADNAEKVAKWALGVLVALLGTVIGIAVLIAQSNGVAP